jgi:hypothetical protein
MEAAAVPETLDYNATETRLIARENFIQSPRKLQIVHNFEKSFMPENTLDLTRICKANYCSETFTGATCSPEKQQLSGIQ